MLVLYIRTSTLSGKKIILTLNLYTMSKLQVVSPNKLRDTINELYYRTCIQHDTPQRVDSLLFEINSIRQQYEIQEEYELCNVCKTLHAEYIIEKETRIANDKIDDLLHSANI